jgi:hypothetical protein
MVFTMRSLCSLLITSVCCFFPVFASSPEDQLNRVSAIRGECEIIDLQIREILAKSSQVVDSIKSSPLDLLMVNDNIDDSIVAMEEDISKLKDELKEIDRRLLVIKRKFSKNEESDKKKIVKSKVQKNKKGNKKSPPDEESDNKEEVSKPPVSSKKSNKLEERVKELERMLTDEQKKVSSEETKASS